MGVRTENYEIAAKGFENTFRAMGFRDFRGSRSRNTGGAFKGPYKSESSCEAELHGSVTRMVYSILSLIGTRNDRKSNSTKFSALQSASYRAVTIVILCLHCAAQDAAQGGPLGSRIPMVPDSGHALGRDYPEIRRKTACEPPISLRL